MFRRASDIAPAGIVLSQPTITTRPSNECPSAASSIESVITSREVSDIFMPSVPIETASETAIVFTSTGIPPASRMPSFTCWARRR